MRKRARDNFQAIVQLALIVLGLVAFVLIGAKLRPFPGSDFLLEYRWWLLAGWAILVMIVHRLIERRIACPVCGTRPFRRIYSGGGDDDPEMRFHVRHCEACGLRQVECHRGVQRLPKEHSRQAAKHYALPKWERLSRRRRFAKRRRCRQCGYDLRATPTEGGPLLDRCPECGRRA